MVTRRTLTTGEGERGLVFFLATLLLAVSSTLIAYTINLGFAHQERQKIQAAADAASLAGVNALGEGTSYATVLSTILSTTAANGVTDSEALITQPECGSWSASFSPQSAQSCDETSNAVEVTIHRSVPTLLGKLFNTPAFNLSARAVSYKPIEPPGHCIRPFGIEQSSLPANITSGATVTVNGTQSAGNWGKIDLDGNSSSGTVYTDLMTTNLCDNAIFAGSTVSVGTGNAAISQVFQTLLADTTPPLAGRNMVVAVTTDFPNGNGTIQILKFILVDLVSQSGSGSKWSATFAVKDSDANPQNPTLQPRALVE